MHTMQYSNGMKGCRVKQVFKKKVSLHHIHTPSPPPHTSHLPAPSQEGTVAICVLCILSGLFYAYMCLYNIYMCLPPPSPFTDENLDTYLCLAVY